MNSLKYLSVLGMVLSLFTNCSSAQKLQSIAPMSFGEVTCVNWNSGAKDGDYGTNLFIPVLKVPVNNIELDSVFFRGKVAKLEWLNDMTNIYTGRYNNEFNRKNMVNKDNPTSETGKKPRFNLKNFECVVSYKIGTVTKYFKLEHIVEKNL